MITDLREDMTNKIAGLSCKVCYHGFTHYAVIPLTIVIARGGGKHLFALFRLD